MAAEDAAVTAPTARQGELHGAAVAALREMIISGQLAPGARKEAEFGAALGISRTPLREALKVLASERLVSLLPNRGAVVAKAGLAGYEAPYDVVATFEEPAARRACERIGDEKIAGIAGFASPDGAPSPARRDAGVLRA